MAEAIATKGNAGTNELQIVIFDLAGETYGADIQAVQAIVRVQQITRIPRLRLRWKASSICAERSIR